MIKIFFFFLFIPVQLIAQQFEMGQSLNSKQLIREGKIATEEVYLFRSSGDSTLYRENSYGGFGETIHSKTFSNSGRLVFLDSFFYDGNHFLTTKKRSSYAGITEKLLRYENDKIGNAISVKEFDGSDSLIAIEENKYDLDGRLLYSSRKKQALVYVTGKFYYSADSLLEKEEICNNPGDSCIISISEYNTNKQLARNFLEAGQMKITTEYFYMDGCRIIEKKYYVFDKNKNTKRSFSDKFVYCQNLLADERLRFVDKKIVEKLKCYYTFTNE